jgi:hypothetical protein
MEPVPYTIRASDVDEVLTAYGAPDDVREDARAHIMEQVLDIDDIVRTAPADGTARQEAALAVIEDILIRDGYVDASSREGRLYPPL